MNRYFFFGGACVRSEAATDLVGFAVCGLDSSLDAFDATGGVVCFAGGFGMGAPFKMGALYGLRYRNATGGRTT